jgi:SDR family mycofactocin-dependent oxidoreductase
MNRLEGKVAFISGVARGQGRAHAVRMAEEGADVIGFDICADLESCDYPLATDDDLEQTIELVEKAGGRIVARKADVRDRGQVEAVLAAGIAALGRVDYVVANAGVMPIMGAKARTAQAWDDGIGVMLTGVFNTVDAAIPRLVEQGDGGCIVITSSTAGLRGFNMFMTAGGLSYVAAKHGVVGLMRAWANQLGSHNIRVNTVHPTGTATPMVLNDAFGTFVSTEAPGVAEAMSNVLPVEMLQPVDIANAVVFLCSDEGRYITGVALPVDAGVTNK